MNDPFSPYDELIKEVDSINKKIDSLIKDFEDLRNAFLVFSENQIETNKENINMHRIQQNYNASTMKKVELIEKRL